MDVKGIEPGKTRYQEATSIVFPKSHGIGPFGFKQSCKKDEKQGQVWYCPWSNEGRYSDHFTVGGVEVSGMFIVDADGLVQGITLLFRPEEFKQIVGAAEGKWGPGKRSEGTVQNRLGAKVDQVEVKWEDDTSSAKAKKRVRADRGSLILTTRKLLESMVESNRKAQQDF